MGASSSTSCFLTVGAAYTLHRQNGTTYETLNIAEAGEDVALYFGDATDSVRGGFIFDTSANILQFRGYNNVEVFRINGSQILAVDGTNSLPAYSFNSNPDTGMFLGSDGIYLSYNAPTSNHLRIDSEGIVFGEGSGGSNTGAIGFSINDGQGNCNISFNHYSGVTDQAGSAYRIRVATDSTGGEWALYGQQNVTAGQSIALTKLFDVTPDAFTFGGSGIELSVDVYTNSSHGMRFFNGATQVGDIGTTDTTWFRINQNTAKNIYTPRYIRA